MPVMKNIELVPIPVCQKCGHPHAPRKSCSAPTPSRALLTTRARNARIKEIVKPWGYDSASTILTEILAGKIVGVLRKDGK